MRRTTPLAALALAAAAGAGGALLGESTGHGADYPGAPRHVAVRYFPASGFIDGIAAATRDGGMWVTVQDPSAFGTGRSSGALIHIGADGKGSLYPLPTTNSYAAYPAVAADGTVWFSYAQGDGSQPTVDTGPALRDEIDSMGWRRPDGTMGRTPITSGAIRLFITDTAAGSDGSVWYTASEGGDRRIVTNNHDVYGRLWPDGRSMVYPLPEGVVYVDGLAPDSDGSVWLLNLASCTVLHVDPDSGAVRSSTRIPGSGSFARPCGGLARSASGTLRLITPDQRIATLDESGRITSLLAVPRSPGDRDGIGAMAEARSGNVWVFTMTQPIPGDPRAIPVLQRIAPNGSVIRYTPIAPGPDPSTTISMATLHQHPEYFDLSPQRLLISADGSVWLGNSALVERLG